jgi:cytochrome c oxidase subunit 1
VHARDAWWYEKHHKEETEKENAEHAKAEAAHGHGIHMPDQSIWPLVTGLGLLIVGFGVTYFDSDWSPGIHAKLGTTLAGFLVVFLGIYFWSLEGNKGYHLHLDDKGNAIEDDHARH